MSSECCDCLTRYREYERKMACFMVREGGATYKPPSPSTRSCRYSFKPHSKLNPSYKLFDNILITRRYEDLLQATCDCTNEQGNEDADGDFNASPIDSDFGTIEKCTSGSWVLVTGDPALCGVYGDGQQCFNYKKTARGTDSINVFRTEHQCGPSCPSVPWSAGRKIDKQDEYAQKCADWK